MSAMLAAMIGLVVVLVQVQSQQQLRGAEPQQTLNRSLSESSPLDYACTREKRLSGQCRWCNRDFPAVGGTWMDTPPYWQYPGPCKNQAFDVEDTRKCMTGRTLYVIGNSIARQSAFNIIEMMGGDPMKREDQREQCPKLATAWGDSCHNEAHGLKIKYLFLQYMDGLNYADRNGFPYFRHLDPATKAWTTSKIASHPGKGDAPPSYYNNPQEMSKDAILAGTDNCANTDIHSCLATFFAGSKSSDVLIFALGMIYAVPPAGTEPAHGSVGVDYHQWALNSGAAFKANVAANFPGQVFRFTHAPLVSDAGSTVKTAAVERMNAVMWNVWAPGSEEKPWYTVDQWQINQGRFNLYDDRVHYNGKLTHAALHQVLNELCPGGGK